LRSSTSSLSQASERHQAVLRKEKKIYEDNLKDLAYIEMLSKANVDQQKQKHKSTGPLSNKSSQHSQTPSGVPSLQLERLPNFQDQNYK